MLNCLVHRHLSYDLYPQVVIETVISSYPLVRFRTMLTSMAILTRQSPITPPMSSQSCVMASPLIFSSTTSTTELSGHFNVTLSQIKLSLPHQIVPANSQLFKSLLPLMASTESLRLNTTKPLIILLIAFVFSALDPTEIPLPTHSRSIFCSCKSILSFMSISKCYYLIALTFDNFSRNARLKLTGGTPIFSNTTNAHTFFPHLLATLYHGRLQALPLLNLRLRQTLIKAPFATHQTAQNLNSALSAAKKAITVAPVARPNPFFVSVLPVTGCRQPKNKYASPGTTTPLPVQDAPGCISAPSADKVVMRPASVPNPALKIVTPLPWQTWHSELERLNLLSAFADVPIGLRDGFHTGVSSTVTRTYTPNNHASAQLHSDSVSSHIHSELTLGRYSGPFLLDQLESLIGPFRTAPLGIIPKPNSDKMRLIQDLSYPRQDPIYSSVNSEIDSSRFPCEWGSFVQCFFFVARSPVGTQVAVFDVESAYRIIPICPAEQPHFCISWNNQFYIDHCAPFGSASACGLFGRVADAFVAICLELGVELILKWVDDLIAFRYPVNDGPEFRYTYDSTLLFCTAYRLRWPWSLPKHRDFASHFKYLGFLWDIKNRTVQIPSDKRHKYLARLSAWAKLSKHTVKDAQALSGTLNHCCLVVPNGRSHLFHLNKFIAGFAHTASPFASHTVSQHLHNELSWWSSLLSQSFVGRSVSQPPPPISAAIFVDASTSWGIGVLIDDKWGAWKFNPSALSQGRDIGWGEMTAVELVVTALCVLFPSNSHFLIRSDNQGVLGAINSGHSRGIHQNASLSRLFSTLFMHNNFLSASYVHTSLNPADPISRGQLPPAHLKLRIPISVDQSVAPFLVRV